MNMKLIDSPVYKDDDLAAHQADYGEEEREELTIAGLAHDIAFLFEDARKKHGPRVSVTIQTPTYRLGPERLLAYLAELGVEVKITEQVLESGRYLQFAPTPRGRHAVAG